MATPPKTEYNRSLDSTITCLRVFLVGITLGLIIFLGYLSSYNGKTDLEKGINQGRIEVFTGQVICRQIPLQGIEIELECKTREEIEGLLRFMQPQGNVK
jgi:tetrahydromethanopterin S-methyltransferase subunit E